MEISTRQRWYSTYILSRISTNICYKIFIFAYIHTRSTSSRDTVANFNLVSYKPFLPPTINLSRCSIWSPWMSLAADQASGVGKSIRSLGVEEAVIPAVLHCPALRSRPTLHRDVCCSTCFWSASLPLKLDDFSDLLCSSLRVNVVLLVLQNSLSF